MSLDLFSFMFGMVIGALIVGVAWKSYLMGMENAKKP